MRKVDVQRAYKVEGRGFTVGIVTETNNGVERVVRADPKVGRLKGLTLGSAIGFGKTYGWHIEFMHQVR